MRDSLPAYDNHGYFLCPTTKIGSFYMHLTYWHAQNLVCICSPVLISSFLLLYVPVLEHDTHALVYYHSLSYVCY